MEQALGLFMSHLLSQAAGQQRTQGVVNASFAVSGINADTGARAEVRGTIVNMDAGAPRAVADGERPNAPEVVFNNANGAVRFAFKASVRAPGAAVEFAARTEERSAFRKVGSNKATTQFNMVNGAPLAMFQYNPAPIIAGPWANGLPIGFGIQLAPQGAIFPVQLAMAGQPQLAPNIIMTRAPTAAAPPPKLRASTQGPRRRAPRGPCVICEDAGIGPRYGMVMVCAACTSFVSCNVHNGKAAHAVCKRGTNDCPPSALKTQHGCRACRWKACVRAGALSRLKREESTWPAPKSIWNN